MTLLETILPRNGDRPFTDPTKANTTFFQLWRPVNKGAVLSVNDCPDQFFIEALSLFVNHDPGRQTFFLEVSTRYRQGIANAG
jgi:hypothetical protein